MTKTLIKKVLTILILIATIHLSAQVPGIDILNGKESISFKFEYKNGLIIVPIRYDHALKLNFIFDTGAEHIVLFDKEYSDFLGSKYDRRINLMGADLSDSLYAYITRNVSIGLKGQHNVTRDIIVLEDNKMKLDEILGLNIDGILGASFFSNLIIQIDYKKKKIHLYHPQHFKYEKVKSHRQMDLVFNNHKPYLKALLTQDGQSTTEQNLLLDTGASLGVLLHHGEDKEIVLPEFVLPGSLGSGIGGMLEGYAGRVPKLQIDTFQFTNILSNFQSLDSIVIPADEVFRNGLLGNDILSRFNIYIDYVNEKLFLKPLKNYNRKFKHDRSGLLIYSFGKDLNQFYVKRVTANSPAAEAGIKEGDIIKKMGWWGVRFYSLERITNKMAGKEGKKIKLTLDRNGEKIKVSFRLRDLLSKNIPKKR